MNDLTSLLVAQEIAARSAEALFDGMIKGTLILSLALLAAYGMRRHSSAARHLVLFLGVIGFLLLPVLSLTLPRWNLLPSWMSVKLASASSGLERATIAAPGQIPSSNHSGNASPLENGEVLPPTSAAISEGAWATPNRLAFRNAGREWTPLQIAFALWLLGTVIALIPLTAGLFRLRHLRRESVEVEDGTPEALLRVTAEKLGIRRRISLYISPRCRMPMTWGVLHPTVLVPEDSLDWPETRLRAVLLHELAHIRRFDSLSNLVSALACAFYWFNPLAWLAFRRIRTEQEQACDDMVLSDGIAPTHYAEELLQVAAEGTSHRWEAMGALTMARRSSLEERILAVLSNTPSRVPSTRRAVTAGLLLTVSALVPLSMLGSVRGTASGTNETDRGLVAWWRAEGNAKDSAGDHKGGFPFGARFAEGITGQGFDFTRSYSITHQIQRVSVPDAPEFELSDELTLEAWVYPHRYGGILLFRGDDRGGYDSWHVNLMAEGNLSYSFNTQDNAGFGLQAPIQLHQWQHVVVAFDHGVAKLYINGVLLKEETTELRPIAQLEPRANPALGIGNTGGEVYNQPFDGLIDEVRIYNRALSEDEILERLNR